MSAEQENEPVLLDFGLNDRADGYVASLTTEAAVEPLATIRLARTDVDRVVLQAARLEMEIRADGLIVVYADAVDRDVVQAMPIKTLVDEAIELMAREDAAIELATLEQALQTALDVVRTVRAHGAGKT